MDLTPYYNRPELISETAQQIIKDFNMVGIVISFSGDPSNAYQELFDQIFPHISSLMEHQKLNTLLYRIDISETQIMELIQNNKEDLPQAISHLIIKRELQKVVIRNYYKSN